MSCDGVVMIVGVFETQFVKITSENFKNWQKVNKRAFTEPNFSNNFAIILQKNMQKIIVLRHLVFEMDRRANELPSL